MTEEPRGRHPVLETIRIRVEPTYLPSHSIPAAGRWVWTYHVRIENAGEETAQLFWRHWLIHDPVAGDQEVQGDGVVGETPWLEPGDVHQYRSYCILASPTGHMEGFYHFRRPDESVFRAAIPRFHLLAPLGEGDLFLT